ncbi:MAG: acid stress-induced BolA-like protein IbaG/YrbA [Halioglobus sp.]
MGENAVDSVTLKAMLEAELADCEISVQGEGNHYDIVAIGNVFEGLRPVQKQQVVYAVLREQIADGSVHAVNIKTFTPQQWQER